MGECWVIIADGDLWVLEKLPIEDEEEKDPVIQLKLVQRTYDMNISYANCVSHNYVYVLTNGFYQEKIKGASVQRGKFEKAGLYCIILDSPNFHEAFNKIQIRETLAGANSKIAVTADKARFAYLHDYNLIELLPVSDSNMITFIGLPDSEDMLIQREENGTFTAFTRFGDIMSWSVVTGMEVFDTKRSLLDSSFNLVDAETKRDKINQRKSKD